MATTSRRQFLRRVALAGESAEGGRHALVCVFLRGAADTLNMLVPHGEGRYYDARPTIAIARPGASTDAAIDLDGFYGFHPKLAPLMPAFREGRLGVVQAVGTDNPTGSHFEVQDQMERGEAYGREIGGGWLGRYLRARRTKSPLAGVAIGTTIPESLRGATSACAISSVDDVQLKAPKGDAAALAGALAALYGAEAGALAAPGRETLRMLERVERLRGASYSPENGASYPDDAFATGLREIARLVKADVGLEVACVDLDGWDTHFLQGGATGLQATLVERLAAGLAAFDADLAGHRERVTTLVMTEFGRRTYENSSAGTDHGRGFAMFAMGGRVNGGKVLGEWPGLEEEADLLGPGGLSVGVDYRSVLWEALERCAEAVDPRAVFPGFIPSRTGLMRP